MVPIVHVQPDSRLRALSAAVGPVAETLGDARATDVRVALEAGQAVPGASVEDVVRGAAERVLRDGADVRGPRDAAGRVRVALNEADAAGSDELLAHTSSISDWHADRVEMLLPEHLRCMIVLVRERDSEGCAGRKTYVTPGLPHWRAFRVGVLTLVELMP